LLGEISNYFRTRDYDTAVHYIEQYIILAREIDDQSNLAEAYYFLAGPLSHLGIVNTALEYYNRSREIYEELDDSYGMAKVYNGFGRIYLEEQDYQEALVYFHMSKELYEEMGDRTYLPHILQNIGVSYDFNEEHEVARSYLHMAHQILLETGDTSRALVSVLLNLGENYEWTNDLEKVYSYYFQALALSKTLDIQPRVADSYFHIARFLKITGQYNQARLYVDSAYFISSEQNSMISLRDQSKLYSEIYEALGDYHTALHYSTEYNRIYHLLRQQETDSQLEAIRFEREISRIMRESEITLHKVKLSRNFTFAAVILLFITLAVIYRNYRMKMKANALLAEMDELKSRMFSNISHELRTPLTLILDPIEQMLDESEKVVPTSRSLLTMQRNTLKILDLVNQMLDLSKLDAGRLKIDLSFNKLVHHLKVIASSFSTLAEKNNIHYTTHYPSGEVETYFDGDKLEKILTNLLGNAFKFTPKEGSVSLSVTVKEDGPKKTVVKHAEQWLFISLHDSGRGIPEDEIARIFDRFYQVGERDDPERVGTGIGLALTKELVDLMKGEIQAESKLNHGTHFNLTLPLGRQHLHDSEYTLSEPGIDEHEGPIVSRKTSPLMDVESSGGGDPENDLNVLKNADPGMDSDSRVETESELDEMGGLPIILVVEDNEDIRNHIKEQIKGFKILEADNGRMGLDKAYEMLPDLVITDIRMPEMDGIELCKTIKEDERTNHIPVIMLTGKSGVESRIEGLKTGADAYLTKPFNSKELNLRVKNLVSQRQKLRERYRMEFLLEPAAVSVVSVDEKFLTKTREIIELQLSDSEFSVEELGKSMALSRMQLFRKIKSLTDQSPSEYIRTIRLKRAAQLIKSEYGNLAEITYEVGFNHPSYFAKCFRELYGVAPSEYGKN